MKKQKEKNISLCKELCLPEIPDYSAYEMVRRSAESHADAPAYSYMGKVCTYRELIEKTDRCAVSFAASGIKKGDIVTICMPNTPETVIAIYALNKIGAVANMIHPLSGEAEMTGYINSAESRMLIVIDMCIEKVKSILSSTRLDSVVVVSPSDSMPALLKYGYKFTAKHNDVPEYGCFESWQHFMAKGDAKHPVNFPKNRADTPAAIMHSGGTTGTPKEIVLINRNFIALGTQGEILLPDIKEGDNVLAILPAFHAFGLGVCIHVTFSIGACAVLVPRFNAEKFAKLAARYRPTMIFGVPTLYEALITSKGADKLKLDNLRYVVSGGDYLSPAMEKRVNAFLKEKGSPAQIIQGYGLTESFGATCLALRDSYKPGSIGRPLPGNEFCIVAPGTCTPLPDNTDGEICICGPTIMLGYRNNEAETKQTLRRHNDGKLWLHTGDIGCRDEDGCYFYKLRMKRLIISSGFNVYPAQIESLIEKHPSVFKCTVIGVPHPYKVEVAKAYIVLKEGCEPTDKIKEEIRAVCTANLAKYAVPARFEFRDSLPQTVIGKTDFAKLKQEHMQALAERKEVS